MKGVKQSVRTEMKVLKPPLINKFFVNTIGLIWKFPIIYSKKNQQPFELNFLKKYSTGITGCCRILKGFRKY